MERGTIEWLCSRWARREVLPLSQLTAPIQNRIFWQGTIHRRVCLRAWYRDGSVRQNACNAVPLPVDTPHIFYVAPWVSFTGWVRRGLCPSVRTVCICRVSCSTWSPLSALWCWDGWIFTGTLSLCRCAAHRLSFGMRRSSSWARRVVL